MRKRIDEEDAGCQDKARLGVMHGFWFPNHFFFGSFSKDARVVIGSFFPRTQLICCNNVTY